MKEEIKERLRNEVIVAEGYTLAIFWNNPELFGMYSDEKISSKTFLNKVYGFYFGLGRHMFDKGVRVFDDISAMKSILEVKKEDQYDEFGNYETIDELMEEVKEKEENLESYYDEIKKYHLLRSLVSLFGDKVLTKNKNYDYKTMSKEELHLFWNDKVNQLANDGDNKYDEFDLLADLEKDLEEWDKNPDIGLPFYESRDMTKITTGNAEGNVYILGGFGGKGKTSFSFSKVIMSFLVNKEKLLVIANEQSVSEFRKMLLVTALGYGTKEYILRQRLNEGNFKDGEKEKLKRAIEWVRNITDNEIGLIKFVFMEDYIISNVKKVIRHYANRGYKSIMIDTGKPTDDKEGMQRWERFTEDFKELYKLTRPNGGGLNLRMWVNVQLSDTALTRRFLNEHALGDSKKIKNEASVLFLMRPMWDDEYENGKNVLTITSYPKDELNPKGYRIEKKAIKKSDGVHYLLFTGKNRRGQDVNTGLRILVFKPNFNNNTWYEVGWTDVFDDKSY